MNVVALEQPPIRLADWRDPKVRQEFVLAWNNGMDTSEIARLMGVSLPTVYSRAKQMGCKKRQRGGRPRLLHRLSEASQRRHESIAPEPSRVVPLRPDNDAIRHGRTVFPSTVKTARETQRILVSGHNNRKIGKMVEKGEWKGMPIFQVTLEERATCPRICYLYSSCYGNQLHLARRHQHGPLFEKRLELELKLAAIENPKGFVCRLHVLGDFYSVSYVNLWRRMLDEIPELRVWGYTAHDPMNADIEQAKIGQALRYLRWTHQDRFALRWSRKTSVPGGSTVIDYVPNDTVVPEGLVCPASMLATACCGTCGFCWSPNARDKTIVFIAHGRGGPAAVEQEDKVE